MSNFPQNRVTDRRIGLTLHQLTDVVDGNWRHSSTRLFLITKRSVFSRSWRGHNHRKEVPYADSL